MPSIATWVTDVSVSAKADAAKTAWHSDSAVRKASLNILSQAFAKIFKPNPSSHAVVWSTNVIAAVMAALIILVSHRD